MRPMLRFTLLFLTLTAPAVSLSAAAASTALEKQDAARLFDKMLAAQGLEYVVAREALVAMGDSALPFLQEKLKDEDWHARVLAEVTLGRIEEPTLYSNYHDMLNRSLRDLFGSQRSGRFRHYPPPLPGISRSGSAIHPKPSLVYQPRPDWIRRLANIDNPIPELNSHSAVPFLLEILMKRCQEVPDSPRPAGRGRPSISVKRQPIDPEEYVPACLSAIYLGFINDARSTDALLEILQADVPLELRASAAAALVKTGETRGLPLVLEILDDKSNPRGLRPLALRALGDATDFMTENLYEISRNEPAGSNRDSAHETLNRIVVENLLSLAILKEEDLYLRSRAALIALGEPAVQFLKPHTSNPDRMAQALARLTIARIKSPEKIEQYEETLRKAVKETVLRQEKWYSVSVDYALAEKGIRNWQPSSEMMTLLSNTLARDLLMEVAAKRTLTPSTDSQDSTEPYPESYGEAAACYAAAARTAIADQSEIKREIRYLIWALGAPNAWRPLRFAMAGLRFNKHAEAKSLLIEYLEHANPRVRREAATALGEVLDAPIAVLEKLAEHDPDSSAQKAAQKALKRIEERAAQEK